MMTAIRFKEIMVDKGLAVDKFSNGNSDEAVTLTINTLHLDEVCSIAYNNDFDYSYDEQEIRNHTMEVYVYHTEGEQNE